MQIYLLDNIQGLVKKTKSILGISERRGLIQESVTQVIESGEDCPYRAVPTAGAAQRGGPSDGRPFTRTRANKRHSNCWRCSEKNWGAVPFVSLFFPPSDLPTVTPSRSIGQESRGKVNQEDRAVRTGEGWSEVPREVATPSQKEFVCESKHLTYPSGVQASERTWPLFR